MTKLTMLCWAGYRDVIASYKPELVDQGIDIRVEEGRNADAIYTRFLAGKEYFDIVIVDWEYRNRYSGSVLRLPDNIVQLSQYLEPFRDRYYFETQHILSFVPLRFGTNGIVHRFAELQKAARQTFGVSELLKGSDDSSIGIWDWWLPNLMLLARAAGFKSPHTMTESQLRQLRDGVLRDFVERVRQCTKKKAHLFYALPDIIEHELAETSKGAKVDWILGPSEMIIAPICNALRSRGYRESLEWQIPKEGGLVWLETAALSESLNSAPQKREAAYRFLRFLQGPSVQLALICGGRLTENNVAPRTYWSYGINNVKGLEGIPLKVRSAFKNPAFEQSAEEFGKWVGELLDAGRLIMRSLPERDQAWRQVWRDAVIQMGL